MKSKIKTSNSKITDKDIYGVFWRWFFTAEPSWNYENMQACGYIRAMGPLVEKLHKDDGEAKERLLPHYQLFNVHKYTAPLILGATAAIEENYQMNDLETNVQTISAIKSGLMGPLAAIGDSILSAIPMTIFGAISVSFGQQGSAVGMIIGILVGIASIYFRKFLFETGYSYGEKIITTMQDKLSSFINAANILGLCVIGGLIASFVSINVVPTIGSGDNAIAIQGMLDTVIPCLLPACFTALIYYTLSKTKLTPTKIILLIFVLSFITYNLHIFG